MENSKSKTRSQRRSKKSPLADTPLADTPIGNLVGSVAVAVNTMLGSPAKLGDPVKRSRPAASRRKSKKVDPDRAEVSDVLNDMVKKVVASSRPKPSRPKSSKRVKMVENVRSEVSSVLDGLIRKVERKTEKKPRSKTVRSEVKGLLDSMVRTIERVDKVSRGDLARKPRAKSANHVVKEEKFIRNPYTGNIIRLNQKTLKPIQHRKSMKKTLKQEATNEAPDGVLPNLFAPNHFEKKIDEKKIDKKKPRKPRRTRSVNGLDEKTGTKI
jgi:hypothetical protein